ncbi:MAG: Gfo/Idh/MocA family oxidoreductase [Roseivivax sp.]|nr:Gfo/Idh/MocA family oxidoreductase [Roseivivax sp.]
MKPVNWGVLGAAKFAREHMAPAIHMARGGRLAALATSSADKAAAFADRVPDLRVHDSYEALLADPEIDAVYIPLPNHMHVDWTLKALDAGKHVLCEKPLALRAEQFDAVIAKRDATGLLAAEAFMIVHHPQWKKARDLVRGGAIGTLVRVEANFSFNNADDPGNIRNTPDTGGGALPDIGVYIFGSTRFVTGQEPERILSSEIVWDNGIDARTHLTAAFPDFHYTGMVSMRLSNWQVVTFHGTEGAVWLTGPFNANVYAEAQVHLQTFKDGPSVTTWRYPNDNHYVLQVEAFNRSVRTGDAYPCPLEFSKGTQRMIDMTYDHARAAR